MERIKRERDCWCGDKDVREYCRALQTGVLIVGEVFSLCNVKAKGKESLRWKGALLRGFLA